LNSTVNERRCRARFCSTFSMMDILSRDKPLILDVRQNGSGPPDCCYALRPVRVRSTELRTERCHSAINQGCAHRQYPRGM